MLPRCRGLLVAVLALAVLGAGACEKVPLLAPSGSTITLTVPTNVLATSQSVDIVAQVLEASGTPPHSGTSITFNTTLGTVQPSTATTDANGRAVVKFQAGTANGVATISAVSGGASTGTNGAIKISIGTAAVGAVRVSANPSSVPELGGSTTVTANVFDINGNGLSGATVIFTTTAGSLSTAVGVTDGSGVATTVLTTTQQATVTANVGAQGTTTTTAPATGGTGTGTSGSTTTSGQSSGSVTVTINAGASIVITPPTTASAGIPAQFTFAVTAATANGSAIRNLRVSWGDGASQDLGAVTGNAVASHTYQQTGTYQVTATLTDASGNSKSVSTVVNVIPVASPTILITPNVPSSCTGAGACTVTFTVQVTPPTGVGVVSASIEFGDGTSSGLGGLTGSATVTHTYTVKATSVTVTVRVVDTLGRTTEGTTVINLP
jgi:hypothetical protein